MSNDHSVARPAARGLTLNSLKDELHSLNMRLLLAIQYHNQETQEDIEAQMATVQKEIDLMCMGGDVRDQFCMVHRREVIAS